MRECRGGVGGLTRDLHGLSPRLAVQGPGGVALQQAVEVVTTAAGVHGGDAGRGGCARARQAGHSCWRHWGKQQQQKLALLFHSHGAQTQRGKYRQKLNPQTKQNKKTSAYHANTSQLKFEKCVPPPEININTRIQLRNTTFATAAGHAAK